MANSNQPMISVEPRDDGRWAVQTDGTQRAVRVYDRKDDAVNDARTRAQGRGAELVVKDQRGQVQSKDSHGSDPRAVRG